MRRWLPIALVLGTTVAGLIACDSGEPSAPSAGSAAAPEPLPSAPPAPPAPRAKSPPDLTGRCGAGNDVVLDALCGDTKPTSLLELRERLGLADVKEHGRVNPPIFGAITSSTSLAVRLTSEANPRVILTAHDRETQASVYLAFARGTAEVELAAEDRTTHALTFYLVRFDPPRCDGVGCGPGALLLPSVESGWTNVTLTRDADLEDTPHDCLGCHRPEGPSGVKRLLIREDERPWLHWMGQGTFRSTGVTTCETDGSVDCDAYLAELRRYDPLARRDPGVAIAEAFASVHAPDELYASVRVSDLLAHEIDYATFRAGPIALPFPTAVVFSEVIASTSTQPFLNVPSGASSAWDAARAATLRAPVVQPFPYQDAKASDPAALARYAATYRDVLTNKAPASALPAANDLLLPAAKRALLIEMEPGLPGEEVLHRGCTQCHNDRVRPELNRARFDATDLAHASRTEKDLAIARLRLPASDPRKMPPPLFRDLDEASIGAAVAALSEGAGPPRSPSSP